MIKLGKTYRRQDGVKVRATEIIEERFMRFDDAQVRYVDGNHEGKIVGRANHEVDPMHIDPVDDMTDIRQLAAAVVLLLILMWVLN